MGPISSEPDGQDFQQTMIDINAPQTVKATMPEGRAANNIQPAASNAPPSSGPGGRPKLDKYAYSSELAICYLKVNRRKPIDSELPPNQFCHPRWPIIERL